VCVVSQCSNTAHANLSTFLQPQSVQSNVTDDYYYATHLCAVLLFE
jgi:hypothetical protein